MQPATTVGSSKAKKRNYCGRHEDSKTVGPGFTTDRTQLNVMLIWQRCGLLIFGDMDGKG
ncbi:hypothetical protein TOPH_02723 [Tolypocladium ophioglossoides CBS 100239]|uniref:Uncharacterized protein n=1 Tax=Tolypocladium ophioglossoides (strain CBS 100239) TaxID=1163406 RepID=A0A0L0NF95_TOLOC|nr:hypothetical protein TOPH_02723 [Tolypocladium ophioglossoides CBS 100239]